MTYYINAAFSPAAGMGKEKYILRDNWITSCQIIKRLRRKGGREGDHVTLETNGNLIIQKAWHLYYCTDGSSDFTTGVEVQVWHAHASPSMGGQSHLQYSIPS